MEPSFLLSPLRFQIFRLVESEQRRVPPDRNKGRVLQTQCASRQNIHRSLQKSGIRQRTFR